MALYGIIGLIGWSLAVFGSGYYFGMDRRDREAKAKEVIDDTEVVK